MNRLLAANNRMRSKGGICQTLAGIVDSVVSRDAIRTSNPNPGRSGWAGPIGLRGMGGIYVHDRLFELFHDKQRPGYVGDQPITLQLILAHEADHLMGTVGHIDQDEMLTTHTIQCSEYGPD